MKIQEWMVYKMEHGERAQKSLSRTIYITLLGTPKDWDKKMFEEVAA